jgi:hypothetical protein
MFKIFFVAFLATSRVFLFYLFFPIVYSILFSVHFLLFLLFIYRLFGLFAKGFQNVWSSRFSLLSKNI